MRRSIFTGLLTAFVLLVACQTARTPPPAPEPVPEFVFEPAPSPPPPPEPPRQFVTVTGSKVNVRKGPATDQAVVAVVNRGDRLVTVGRREDWFEVRLEGDAPGFVSARYARVEEPCLPDTATPQLLTPPPMSFSQVDRHGTIQLRLSIDAKGEVSGVRIVSNSTGDPTLEKQAEDEVKTMRFAPLIRRCRPTAFVYLFNRTF